MAPDRNKCNLRKQKKAQNVGYCYTADKPAAEVVEKKETFI